MLNNKSVKINNIIIGAILFTASFDIVGTINISGMTFRITQLFIVIGFLMLLSNRAVIPINKGCYYLILWLVLQFVACLTSDDYLYSFGYYFWTLLDVAIIVVFVGLTKTEKQAETLLRIYIYSMVAIAALGLFQFVMSLLGVNFYLTQPTLNGTMIPRLNGFTFEPSYYATYLLPGWVLIMYLWEKGSVLFREKQLLCFAAITTLALFLSTSRMGWIFMAVWLAYRGSCAFFQLLKGRIKKHLAGFVGALFVGLILVTIVGSIVIANNGADFLISGLGIGGGSDHSSSTRIEAMIRTLELFKFKPWIGYSLGGLPVAFCDYYSMDMNTGVTMCVWAELLVASGIAGFLTFAIWIMDLVKRVIDKSKQKGNEGKGLVYALVFECGILTLNQNILRIYFWTLIAVIAVYSKKTLLRKNSAYSIVCK